jgi:hypothetical protein
VTLAETRKKAWETRRALYGPMGHGRAYSGHLKLNITGMRDLIIRLMADGVLSEGQAAKATGLHRITIRKLADALELSR